MDGYRLGDTMKMSWEGTVDAKSHDDQLEYLWVRFNQDDRPNGRIAHSLSVGDVVVLDSEAYRVDAMGFSKLGSFEPVIGDYK